MDSRGAAEFPGSLDRTRLYPTSGTPGLPLLGSTALGDAAAARHSSLAAADLAQASTPVAPGSVDPLVAAHYQNRLAGLPPPPSLLLHSPTSKFAGVFLFIVSRV